MRKRQKKDGLRLAFYAIGLFLVGIVTTIFYTPAVDANATLIDVHTWFNDIRLDLGSNIAVLGVSAAVLAVAYYFLVHNAKVSR